VRATVVILTKLPGHLPVKTRLRAALGEAGARAVHLEMLATTVGLARTFDPEPVIAYSPPDADPRAALPGIAGCRFVPVEGSDGATCLEHAVAAAAAGLPLVALGGDAPDLPRARIGEALAALAAGRDAVVVPTPDGGFSCLALRRPVPGLARAFRYGAGDARSSLLAFFAAQGLATACLEPWPDVDTPEDLEAYRRRAVRLARAMNEGLRFDTRAIHAGQAPDPTTGAIMTPIYQTSTYVQEAPAVHKGYVYARGDNPTRRALEGCLASLEGAAHCTATSSGLGAETVVLTDLGAGARVVAGNDLYGGTYRLFERVFRNLGLAFQYVDATDLDQVAGALREKTDLLWLETPTNPLLRVTDIAATAALARDRGVPVLVDNTFASPYLQRPLEHGADVVLHSMTKYIGGHSDVVGGAVLTNDAARADRYAKLTNWTGPVPGPLDAFLVLRGLKTLHVRMERHCDNAEALAHWLEEHPRVKRVHYPGLPSHPGHAVAKRQMARFGGMLSLELDGTVEDGKRFCAATRVFSLAESLGGVESLIEHPASMTHASVPPEERRKAGFEDGLIRLSVGIEDLDDLREDLDRALTA